MSEESEFDDAGALAKRRKLFGEASPADAVEYSVPYAIEGCILSQGALATTASCASPSDERSEPEPKRFKASHDSTLPQLPPPPPPPLPHEDKLPDSSSSHQDPMKDAAKKGSGESDQPRVEEEAVLETIELPAYINRGKLIGKKGSNIEMLKKDFNLESVHIQDAQISVRGLPSSIESFKTGHEFEGVWQLDHEGKDYDYWKDCLQDTLPPACKVKFGGTHTAQSSSSQLSLAVPRKTLIIEATLRALLDAEETRRKLDQFGAIMRVNLDDYDQWAPGQDDEPSYDFDTTFSKLSALNVELGQWDKKYNDTVVYLTLTGEISACLQAKADLSFQLVRKEEPERLRGCILNLPIEVATWSEDQIRIVVFNRFFQDPARFGDIKFGIIDRRAEMTVLNHLPKDLPLIRLQAENTLNELHIVSKVSIPEPAGLANTLPTIINDFGIAVFVEREKKTATVIGLSSKIREGVNRVAAEGSPKTWRLCELNSEVLEKFRNAEGCKKEAVKALKSAQMWWAESRVTIGPTEDDLLYHSTLQDARDVAHIVTSHFGIDLPKNLRPKDVFSELPQERR